MDRWKFFDITHRDHVFCNPLNGEKVDEIIGLLDLKPGARVLDIACGKAEVLVRMAERHGIAGVGVDLSPYCVRDAREKANRRAPQASLTFLEMDGADYESEPGSFDVAMCLGASWTFGGHLGILRALARFVRRGGLVLTGEPFWKRAPAAEYLAAAGLSADEFGTHAGNVAIGVREGLTPLYALVSSDDDWDRYEGLQWRAAETYAAEHPDDPDLPELLNRVRQSRDSYLRWGRDTLGWAVYLFRA